MAATDDASFDRETAVELSGAAEDFCDSAAAEAPRAAADERPESNSEDGSRVDSSVNRVLKHELPKQRVAARLRRLGATVRAASAASSYDMVVNGDTRVTLRVAYPGLRHHRVTVAGRSYRYRYRTWHFNFHHHGRLADRYTDYFVCIAVNPKGRDEVFVIPWEQVTGKTFSLHGGRGRYNGRYAPFRDGWERVLDNSKGGRTLRHVA